MPSSNIRRTLRVQADGKVTLGLIMGPLVAKIEKRDEGRYDLIFPSNPDDPESAHYLEWSGTSRECVAYLCGKSRNDPRVQDIDFAAFRKAHF